MNRIVAPALCLLAVAACAVAAQETKPTMQLSQGTWDFGELEQGQIVSRTIQVLNTGAAELRITNLRVSCPTCVGATMAEKAIAPGKSADLVLSFYSKGEIGPQNKTVYVHGNDPDHEFLKIALKGTVKKGIGPRLELAGDVLDFGLVQVGKDSVRALTVKNAGHAPLTVERIATMRKDAKWFSGPRRPSPGGEGTIKLALKGGALKKGLVQGFVGITTNDPLTPTVTVTLTGYAADLSGAAGTPAGVLIQPAGEPVKLPGTDKVFYRTYRVANHLSAPVDITKTGTSDVEGRAETIQLAPGEAMSIDVPATALAAGTLPVTIHLPATHPEE